MKRKRGELQVQPSKITRMCTKLEVNKLVEGWLHVFGNDKVGINARAYMWHIFSFERYPSLAGVEAQSEYEKHLAAEYIVLSNDRDMAFYTDQRPSFCSLRDYLVFPANLAWTMAITHEDGWLGPYFARHTQYEKLKNENLAKLQKSSEVEFAMQRGWL